jgi:hypothetical protein
MSYYSMYRDVNESSRVERVRAELERVGAELELIHHELELIHHEPEPSSSSFITSSSRVRAHDEF